jgi:hypothetical protein
MSSSPWNTPTRKLLAFMHRGRLIASRPWSRSASGLDCQERVRARPQRIQIVAWLASSRLARHVRIWHDGCHPTSGQQAGAQKNKVERNAKTSDLIRWSIQEIRRIAQRLTQKRIQPADIIAWSLWRRAHQATAQKLISNKNHNCNARAIRAIVSP